MRHKKNVPNRLRQKSGLRPRRSLGGLAVKLDHGAPEDPSDLGDAIGARTAAADLPLAHGSLADADGAGEINGGHTGPLAQSPDIPPDDAGRFPCLGTRHTPGNLDPLKDLVKRNLAGWHQKLRQRDPMSKNHRQRRPSAPFVRITPEWQRLARVRLAELEWHQKDLADAIGASYGAITHLLKAGSKQSRYVLAASAALEIPEPTYRDERERTLMENLRELREISASEFDAIDASTARRLRDLKKRQ